MLTADIAPGQASLNGSDQNAGSSKGTLAKVFKVESAHEQHSSCKYQ